MAARCPLCWYEFPTIEELAQHEDMERAVDWPLATNPQRTQTQSEAG